MEKEMRERKDLWVDLLRGWSTAQHDLFNFKQSTLRESGFQSRRFSFILMIIHLPTCPF